MTYGNLRREITRLIQMYIQLHGVHNFTATDIYTDVLKWRNTHTDPDEAKEIFSTIQHVLSGYYEDLVEYGIFLGRCQPYTIGHDGTVQRIKNDGRTPLIFLGSIDKHDEKNPLPFEERREIIEEIHPEGIKIIGLEDKNDWTLWFNNFKNELDKLGILPHQVKLYAHNKVCDNKDFIYEGEHYADESYTVIFEKNGINIVEIDEVLCTLGNTIHASDVRKDEEVAIRNLDPRTYKRLKEKGWW